MSGFRIINTNKKVVLTEKAHARLVNELSELRAKNAELEREIKKTASEWQTKDDLIEGRKKNIED